MLLRSGKDEAPVPQEGGERRDLQRGSGLHQVTHPYNTVHSLKTHALNNVLSLNTKSEFAFSRQKHHEEGGARGLPEGGQLPGAGHRPSLRHRPGGLLCRGGGVPAGVHASEHLLLSLFFSHLLDGRQLRNGAS